MFFSKNEGTIDRLLRVILGEILFIIGYFWLGGAWQVAAYVIAAISLFTALTGFCALYKLIHVSTAQKNTVSTWIKGTFVLLFIAIAFLGSYYSIFFSNKFFLDDYNRMNNFYKQTLFFTGQENRQEAVANYELLVNEYAQYQNKYATYHPYVLKSDVQFTPDTQKVASIISDVKENVYTGNLKQAHTSLEAVRPIFQDILKRNGFSMLAVYLVDFHDAMEKVLEPANAKNASGVISAYEEANAKLKAVEEIANDDEIKMIRQKLEETLTAAKNNEVNSLPTKASELKSAFVKVYLKRG